MHCNANIAIAVEICIMFQNCNIYFFMYTIILLRYFKSRKTAKMNASHSNPFTYCLQPGHITDWDAESKHVIGGGFLG